MKNNTNINDYIEVLAEDIILDLHRKKHLIYQENDVYKLSLEEQLNIFEKILLDTKNIYGTFKGKDFSYDDFIYLIESWFEKIEENSGHSISEKNKQGYIKELWAKFVEKRVKFYSTKQIIKPVEFIRNPSRNKAEQLLNNFVLHNLIYENFEIKWSDIVEYTGITKRNLVKYLNKNHIIGSFKTDIKTLSIVPTKEVKEVIKLIKVKPHYALLDNKHSKLKKWSSIAFYEYFKGLLGGAAHKWKNLTQSEIREYLKLKDSEYKGRTNDKFNTFIKDTMNEINRLDLLNIKYDIEKQKGQVIYKFSVTKNSSTPHKEKKAKGEIGMTAQEYLQTNETENNNEIQQHKRLAMALTQMPIDESFTEKKLEKYIKDNEKKLDKSIDNIIKMDIDTSWSKNYLYYATEIDNDQSYYDEDIFKIIPKENYLALGIYSSLSEKLKETLFDKRYENGCNMTKEERSNYCEGRKNLDNLISNKVSIIKNKIETNIYYTLVYEFKSLTLEWDDGYEEWDYDSDKDFLDNYEDVVTEIQEILDTYKER